MYKAVFPTTAQSHHMIRVGVGQHVNAAAPERLMKYIHENRSAWNIAMLHGSIKIKFRDFDLSYKWLRTAWLSTLRRMRAVYTHAYTDDRVYKYAAAVNHIRQQEHRASSASIVCTCVRVLLLQSGGH